MAADRAGLGDNHHNNALPAAQVIIPPYKQPRLGETRAVTDLVWVSQGFGDALPMLWQEIGVVLSNVPLSLLGQLNLPA
ncbi:MAG: hypothetical protein ACRDIC_21585 [bacterium]